MEGSLEVSIYRELLIGQLGGGCFEEKMAVGQFVWAVKFAVKLVCRAEFDVYYVSNMFYSMLESP